MFGKKEGYPQKKKKLITAAIIGCFGFSPGELVP